MALRSAKANRVKVLKLIHGYGSSGRGGAIRADVLAQLARKKRAGQIQEFVRGEIFPRLTAGRGRWLPFVRLFPVMLIIPEQIMALRWCCYSKREKEDCLWS